ncbi:MAG: hypothetical protein O3A14_19350 [Cyanobacteria bacterium]|nr:hypothetical protein [Cyanobacteriota bacterium]
MNSYWRQRAREVIHKTLLEWEGGGGDIDKAIAAISDAYPFGTRSNHPYKQWLKERKIAIAFLNLLPARPVDAYLHFAGNCEASELLTRNRRDFVSPGQLSLLP